MVLKETQTSWTGLNGGYSSNKSFKLKNYSNTPETEETVSGYQFCSEKVNTCSTPTEGFWRKPVKRLVWYNLLSVGLIYQYNTD